MPEYLAPGVYVEEVPSGNKPLEGVSTSTTGMVGVTRRGPVNEPTLTTSFADFVRKFGGYLDHRVMPANPAGLDLDALPYAADGFFTNGGQRLYVTRVAGPGAAHALVDLYGVPQTNTADTALSQRVAAGEDTLLLDDGTNISNGDRLLIHDGPRSEYVVAQSDPVAVGVRIYGQLAGDHADGAAVTPQTVTEGDPFAAAADFDAGDTTLALVSVGDLAAAELLRIQDTANGNITEYVSIASVDGGANTVDLDAALQFDHPAATTEIHRVTFTAGTATALSEAAEAGDFLLSLDDTTDFAVDGVLIIGSEMHAVRSVVSSLSIVTSETQFIHTGGTVVMRQIPLLRVYARDPGAWGNDLRLTVRNASVLETRANGNFTVGDSPIILDAVFSLSGGSVLEFDGGTRQLVASVNANDNEVDFVGGITVNVSDDDNVNSIEFDLIVERLNGNGKVVESEAFMNLGMHSGHTRYAPNTVGVFDEGAMASEGAGESALIRLVDLTTNDTDRLAVPFAGVTSMLDDGDDDFGNITNQTYIGLPSTDPDLRTGIYAMENIDDISITAVPGQWDQDVQNRLLSHCAYMRYRFAVLDSEANARMADVQTQRSLYDTTYGTLYYPWLTISDSFGRNGDVLHIPPSGHVAGVYARTDVQRGVHKAPANEVVMGIRDLQVRLTKGEQDILNPKHINCIRDFRDMNRALRIWGARTLSSDPEWKYINVRRLFLMVEKTIETGTQWAVFEPNAEPLWATIYRSVSNFLTTVWRSGALEGTKAEEAFFVKVDRTTMTQDDIDNGRLIVIVGIAPVKPAEFVIFRISQKTREATG